MSEYFEIPVGEPQQNENEVGGLIMEKPKNFLVNVNYVISRDVIVQAYRDSDVYDIVNAIDVDLFTDPGSHDLKAGYNITLLGEKAPHGSGAALLIGECDEQGHLLSPQE